MCGIAGYISERHVGDDPRDVLYKMAGALHHRGPDATGTWQAHGVGFAHARLSVLDLSPAGQQPMESSSGRFIITYNGEIYNHGELKDELNQVGGAPEWRGSSDTEILLACLEFFGLEKTLQKANGMFAFGLWDKKTRELILARDRFGEKPLYYARVGQSIVFASELKSLKYYPEWTGRIDRNSIYLYLLNNCIPAPFCIYKGVKKLLPGTYIRIGKKLSIQGPNQYYTPKTIAEKGGTAKFTGTQTSAVNGLRALLGSAVAARMHADVPVGCFLSGGIDSSLITALMQEHSSGPVKTFCIGFEDSAYDEAPYAKAVSDHLGTNHTSLYLTSKDVLSVIPKLPNIYDEPFSDSSQIPSYLVSCLARQHVVVALSGDGGDELFGGYNRHAWVPEIWKRIKGLPPVLKQSMGGVLAGVSPEGWDKLYHWLARILPDRYRVRVPGKKLHKIGRMMAADSVEEAYLSLRSHWQSPWRLLRGCAGPLSQVCGMHEWPQMHESSSQMMYLDLVSYLPDDILVKVDRASMATSLEVRVPFLDPGVVDFALSLPLSMKIHGGKGKWILRKLLRQYLTERLIERPKAGFAVPIGPMLSGPLRDWAESLINEKSLREQGIFYPKPILGKWKEHLSGGYNWEHHLWNILMFQAWMEQQ